MNSSIKKLLILSMFIVMSFIQTGRSMEFEGEKGTSPSYNTTNLEILRSMPGHFFGSLFEPFANTDAQQFYQSQWSQIQESGWVGYGLDKVKRGTVAAISNPLDSLSSGLGMALSWTNIAELSSVIPFAAQALNGVKNSKTLYLIGSSFDGEKLISKGIKFAFYGGALFAVASFLAAAALEWNSLADATAHYSGGSCPSNPWDQIMDPVVDCLKAGGSLESCQDQIPASYTAQEIDQEIDKDLYAFTRHGSANPDLDPVSIVRLDKEGTCFLTALEPKSPVTKTCFKSLADLDTRTVETMKGLSLLRAHEGLKAGQSVRHVGLHLGYRTCGHFGEAPAKYTLGEQPACLLTALKPGGDVTQLCFDPNNPESLTIKEVEGILLDFKDNGEKPVSIVIKDPRKFGLDVRPQESSNPQPSDSAGVQEGSTVCEEGKCYRYEKVEIPCGKEKGDL